MFGRHCEGRSDAAIEEHVLGCFASLAMTKHLLVAALLLVGCKDNRPPQPSAEQSQQLNEADEMLNGMAQNEEGPEANAPSPSNSSD